MTKILVIPSIDIKDGKTVRVVQGIPELDCKAYGNDPVQTAKLWRAENAKTIHVVDFNCSWEHSHKNFDIIGEMCSAVVIPVEMGGGIQSLEEAKEIKSLGVFRLIIGSLARENPREFIKILDHFGPQFIAAAIDVIDDEVITRGRKVHTEIDPVEYATELRTLNVDRFIVTDIKSNGMLGGPNIELSKRIAEATGAKVTLSGGLRGFDDLIEVQKEAESGIDSVIVGRALYENKFSCQKIWRVAEAGIFDTGE